MRVISGKLKGRGLKGYHIQGTRPTMDRVKESVFASIQDRIVDSVVLDLFAGSGALGIEAISNGARECYFVDSNRECIKVIRDNLQSLGIEDKCLVMQSDYQEALKNFKRKKYQFDLIFIDPPYRYHLKNEILRMIMEWELLSDDGIIVFEYQEEEEIDRDILLDLIKTKKYGDKYVSIYKKS